MKRKQRRDIRCEIFYYARMRENTVCIFANWFELIHMSRSKWDRWRIYVGTTENNVDDTQYDMHNLSAHYLWDTKQTYTYIRMTGSDLSNRCSGFYGTASPPCRLHVPAYNPTSNGRWEWSSRLNLCHRGQLPPIVSSPRQWALYTRYCILGSQPHNGHL